MKARARKLLWIAVLWLYVCFTYNSAKREYEIRALRCPRKQKLADLQIRKKIRIDSKLQLAFFILSPARATCCVLSIWMLMHSCGLCF